jgi:DNA-binding Xre family transcriptional regulator
MNLPYSFNPLFSLLEDLDLTPDNLVTRKIISRQTLEKIINGQQVMLVTPAKICISLGCELTDIIELNYDFNPAEEVDDGTQNYKPWSLEEENKLIDEYQNGFPIEEIAKSLKRSPGAVSSRIGRLIYGRRLEKRQ